jgi:hypothetical protein
VVATSHNPSVPTASGHLPLSRGEKNVVCPFSRVTSPVMGIIPIYRDSTRSSGCPSQPSAVGSFLPTVNTHRFRCTHGAYVRCRSNFSLTAEHQNPLRSVACRQRNASPLVKGDKVKNAGSTSIRLPKTKTPCVPLHVGNGTRPH